jgi:hypothetical protein
VPVRSEWAEDTWKRAHCTQGSGGRTSDQKNNEVICELAEKVAIGAIFAMNGKFWSVRHFRKFLPARFTLRMVFEPLCQHYRSWVINARWDIRASGFQ